MTFLLKDKNYQPVIPQYIKQYRFSNIEGSLRLVFELQNNIKIRKKSFKDFNNQNLQKIIIEFESTNNENQKNIYLMKCLARQESRETYHADIIANKTESYYRQIIQKTC